MTTIKPYRMKVSKPKRESLGSQRLRPKADEGDIPPLTGFWGEIELGSAEEERLLRGLSKLGRSFSPQYLVDTPYSLPGQEKQVDIVIWDSMLLVEVDSIWHRQQFSKEQDAQRDAVINEVMQPRGFKPVQRVDGERFLQSQQDADRLAEELA